MSKGKGDKITYKPYEQSLIRRRGEAAFAKDIRGIYKSHRLKIFPYFYLSDGELVLFKDKP
jgi:hypothetical protein